MEAKQSTSAADPSTTRRKKQASGRDLEGEVQAETLGGPVGDRLRLCGGRRQAVSIQPQLAGQAASAAELLLDDIDSPEVQKRTFRAHLELQSDTVAVEQLRGRPFVVDVNLYPGFERSPKPRSGLRTSSWGASPQAEQRPLFLRERGS